MARVTVEDCVTKIPNRFELVMLAAQRARNITAGTALTVDRDNDKNPVVSLREIAEETVDLGELEESLITSLQHNAEMDEPEEEEMDMLAIQQGLAGEGDGEMEANPRIKGMYEDVAEPADQDKAESKAAAKS